MGIFENEDDKGDDNDDNDRDVDDADDANKEEEDEEEEDKRGNDNNDDDDNGDTTNDKEGEKDIIRCRLQWVERRGLFICRPTSSEFVSSTSKKTFSNCGISHSRD